SLLGVTRVDQLERLTLKPEEADSVLLEPAREAIRATLDEVRAVRERIEATDAVDIREVEEKAASLALAEARTAALRTVGDLVVGAAVEETAGKGKATTIVEAAAEEICAALLADSDAERDALIARIEARAGDALMVGRAPGDPDPPKPFHWVLEFPEVFERDGGGFDAIVGNPPFLGGKKVSGVVGTNYREYVVNYVASRQRGNADLVAYFFLRASRLVRVNATFGLVATNSIGQGESRRVSLERLQQIGWTIYRAVKSRQWPGEAVLHVSHVWAQHDGSERTHVVLDDRPVRRITPSLEPAGRVEGSPRTLSANHGIAHYGCIINGHFDMQPDEAAAMVNAEPRNAEVVRPYLIAKDLTERPDQSVSRWAVDFSDMDLDVASSYLEPMEYVRRHVLPWRETLENK
ncbi:MAG: Eco57I restriction-modification methylase domain-containing protein, partial [Vicinamibacterales bacterium]